LWPDVQPNGSMTPSRFFTIPFFSILKSIGKTKKDLLAEINGQKAAEKMKSG
jgi:hypothetical protein